MSARDEMDVTDQAVVGACRMALEIGESDEVALAIMRVLIDKAPPTPQQDAGSVHLLVTGLRQLNGKFTVPEKTAEKPRTGSTGSPGPSGTPS